MAEIIDVAKLPQTGKVIFGATVEIEDNDTGKTTTYQVVGEDEADIRMNLIAITSPIARALIGKLKDDEVEFDAPGGRKSFVIVGVRYE
jgi:transcription elongation factor GreA